MNAFNTALITKYRETQLPTVVKKTLIQKDRFSALNSFDAASMSFPHSLAMNFDRFKKGKLKIRRRNFVASLGYQNNVKYKSAEIPKMTEQPIQNHHIKGKEESNPSGNKSL